MKILTMKSFAAMIMIGSLAVISFAQDIRVQLTAGGEGKSLTRTLAPNSNVVFTFKASAGQTISFTAGYDFKDSDLLVYLLKDNEQLKSSGPKAPNEFLVKKTGDYQVVVENKTNKRVTTTLYLDLFDPEDMRDPGADVETEALSFEGSDMATVSKTIPANGTIKFTFDGTKGINALVQVTDRTNQLTVVFNESQNQKADTTIALNKQVTRKLTKSQEYTIEVINQSSRSVKFNLEVILDSSGMVQAQTPQTITEEVRFAPGATSSFLKRTLDANGSIEFSFYAKKGQRMVYSVNYNMNNNRNSNDLELFFMETGAQDFIESGIADEPNEFRIKSNGIHTVQVVNKTGKKVTFEFGLSIL
ncbi:MAG: hypothetical protein IPI64_15060 [Chloracidobacterium sp.]|nr:hypothetical protein [Chloracidobacterium sp.]